MIATVPQGDRDDARPRDRRRACAADGWARLTAFERAAKMHAVGDIIEARRDELARTLTLDQGKPLRAEAYGEVDELVEYWRMAAEDAKRLGGELPNSFSPGKRVMLVRRAARRGRRDQPVELALHDACRAGRARARVRQRRGVDAGAVDRGVRGRAGARASPTPTCRRACSTSSRAPALVVGDEIARNPGTDGRRVHRLDGNRSAGRRRRPQARRRCSRWAATVRSW